MATVPRLLATTLGISFLGIVLALVASRGISRRLTAERLAPVLAEAIPSSALQACREGRPSTARLSEALEFHFHGARGEALTPGAPPLDTHLLARLSRGERSTGTSDMREVRVLIALPDAGGCAYAQAHWRTAGRAYTALGGWLLASLALVGAALAAGVIAFVARPFVMQLQALGKASRSIGTAAWTPPPVVLAEATPVASALADAHARVLDDATHLRGRGDALEALLAELTHDVRTPLASLQLALDEIAEQTSEEALPALRRALSDLMYMKSLTSNLRLAERLQPRDPVGGAREPRPALDATPIEVSAILRRVVERAQPFALRRGVELVSTLAEHVQVRGDATATEQTFTNLLDNAIAYGDPGTHVSVMLDATGVVVEDDGPGVIPDELPRLGTRAFRGHTARTRDAKGSGLGLAIAREVCERSGWTIAFARNETPTPQSPRPHGFRVTIRFTATPSSNEPRRDGS
ncbi:sensor histidine kinase [Cystobacter fuscus]|uniref:sensor histidine kinase n=1 Tax=Cystobacter fuscus TaxID=43 RepID=UPI000BB2FA8F|nr:HAMP domain-containing sensor histidine kinase [Cystobacter fuscus]